MANFSDNKTNRYSYIDFLKDCRILSQLSQGVNNFIWNVVEVNNIENDFIIVI